MSRQTSFASGELSPELWGRSELARYESGARRLRDFLPNAAGNAMSRPSTLHVGAASSNLGVRLVPFIYSDAQSYVLEFTPNAIHVWHQGALVTSGGPPVLVATTYAADVLPLLKWTQSGDVLTLEAPGHPPRELRRMSHTLWILVEKSFARPGFGWDVTPVLGTPLPVADADHPAREWKWKVTTLVRQANGDVVESLPATITHTEAAAVAPDKVAVYPDRPMTLVWTGGTTYAALVGFRVYRGRGTLFGLVGETDVSFFVDSGDLPDYAQAPPKGTNPLQVLGADGAVAATERPRTAAYFQQRLVFGGTEGRPATLFLSRTGDYSDFDRHDFAPEDGAMELELASRRREEVRWMLALRELLVGTNASVWRVAGAGGAPLSAISVDAAPQSEVGSSWLDPIVVGNDVLFVRAKGTGVRMLRYSEGGGGYVGADVSLQSRHLFEGFSIVDWCYQEDPDSVVWAARSDGKLLSLTYSPENEVAAWALHTLNGSVRALCSVPEGEEDVVYLAVERAGAFYLERFASRRLPLGEDGKPDPLWCFSLDSAGLVMNDPAEDPTTEFSVGVPHLADGTEVWAVCDGDVVGPRTVTDGIVYLPGSVQHVGVRFQPELESLDLPARTAKGSSQVKMVKRVTVDLFQSRGLWAGESLSGRGLQVGEDGTALSEWQQRTVEAGFFGPLPYETGTATIDITGSWNPGGRVLLRQTVPLPITVLALNREVESGGA